MRLRKLILAALSAFASIVAVVSAPAALAGETGEPAPAAAPAEDPGSILVLGERPVAELPTQTVATPEKGGRGLASESAFFVRCAKLPHDTEDLREIVDRGPNDALAKRALHRYIIRNRACYNGIPNTPSLPASPHYGECNPQLDSGASGGMSGAMGEGMVGGLCRNIFDRGALFEAVLARYAPDYALSRFLTFDREVRARFMARRDRRNEFGERGDSTFYDTVACFVQISPDWAARLLRAKPGSPAETRARQYLIGLGSPCVGGVREVQVNSSQFRVYTAEAVYGWIVAAKGGDTLVE